MSKRSRKYAAVAAIAACIILGLTFIEGKSRKGGKAWALEQSIQALQSVRSICCKGTMSWMHMARQGDSASNKELEGKIKAITFEGWAISDNGVDESKAKLVMYFQPTIGPSGEPATITTTVNGEKRTVPLSADEPATCIVKRDGAAYTYAPALSNVCVQDADAIYLFHPWPGPTFEGLMKDAQKPGSRWQESYGKDNSTGRECVYAKYVAENAGVTASFWVQFDLESKLPVQLKAWDNPNWEGVPDVMVDPVYNTEIPDSAFTVPITAKSLQVSDERQGTPPSEKSFNIDVPGGTCRFPEIVESALRTRARPQPTSREK